MMPPSSSQLLLLVAITIWSSMAAATSLRRTEHEKTEQYEILPSSAILERLQKLVADYPTFATLTTTQEWFGLPRAGTFALWMGARWSSRAL